MITHRAAMIAMKIFSLCPSSVSFLLVCAGVGETLVGGYGCGRSGNKEQY